MAIVALPLGAHQVRLTLVLRISAHLRPGVAHAYRLIGSVLFIAFVSSDPNRTTCGTLDYMAPEADRAVGGDSDRNGVELGNPTDDVVNAIQRAPTTHPPPTRPPNQPTNQLTSYMVALMVLFSC